MQRGKREHQPNRRAVRICNDESLSADALLLSVKRVQVIRVDLRNQQRHVRLHPMVAGIADNGNSRPGQIQFHLFRDASWQA